MAVLWLGEEECHLVGRVGGKAANLSQLAASYRVPAGFCLPPEMRTAWADSPSTASASPSVPQDLRDIVSRAYQSLADRCGSAEPSVAVRSSAMDEDGQASSFAGQYETYLNMQGTDAVTEAIVKCWDSAYSERMVSYRKEHNLSEDSAGISVLVQQLVPAEISGVAFSANPVTGLRDEVMINAAWGLGESVVSGKVTPDTITADRGTFRIREKYLGEKSVKTVLGETGTREVRIPVSQQKQFSLDEAKIREVAELAVGLEAKMGWPVDLEFAYFADDLYLLQCRPITTL